MPSDFTPLLMPLGDRALLVRCGSKLTEQTNDRAISLARVLKNMQISGVGEILANLASVSVFYDPKITKFKNLVGEVQLAMNAASQLETNNSTNKHEISVEFGGELGPDISEVAKIFKIEIAEFIRRHNEAPLKVLATGFAPGFVYCGMHAEGFHLPRRAQVRPQVPAGSILFAAGQTAIAATQIPTGWHVIGRTKFRNFIQERKTPTIMQAGDTVKFKQVKT